MTPSDRRPANIHRHLHQSIPMTSKAATKAAVTTSKPCSKCGVDVPATIAKVEKATQRLKLMEEKLQVDQKILNNDKQNFKRRLKAAKLAAANRQVDLERQELQKAQKLEEKHDQTTKKLKSKHQEERERLEEKIKILESFQQAREHDSKRQWQSQIDERQALVDRLQQQLEEKEFSMKSLEAQLMELQRQEMDSRGQHNSGDDDASHECSSCQQLSQQLDQMQRRIRSIADEHTEVLNKERNNYQEVIRERDLFSQQVQRLQQQMEQISRQLEQETLQRQKEKDDMKNMQQENQVLNDQIKYLQELHPSTPDPQDPTAEAASSSTGILRPPPLNPKTHTRVLNKEWYGESLAGIYIGYWSLEHNEPDVHGTLRVEDGAIYDGKWHRGMRHGHGVYATIEGDVYHGEWRNGQYDGWGTLVWSDGRVYRGHWKDGKRHDSGSSLMTWPHGATYQGPYEKDKRSGASGRYTYPDGRTYSGAYRDDRPHGRGTLTDAQGTVVYDGHWEFGEFLGDDDADADAL